MDDDLRAELLGLVERGRVAFAMVEALMEEDRSFAEELTGRAEGGMPLVLLDWPEAPGAFQEMVAVDRENARRLAEIVRQVGWPGIQLAGADGEEAAWEVAMHADTAQRERLTWLPLIDEAARLGDVPPQHAEYLRLRANAVQALAPPADNPCP